MNNESFNRNKNYKGLLLELLVSKENPIGRGTASFQTATISISPPLFQCTLLVKFPELRLYTIKSNRQSTKKEAEQQASCRMLTLLNNQKVVSGKSNSQYPKGREQFDDHEDPYGVPISLWDSSALQTRFAEERFEISSDARDQYSSDGSDESVSGDETEDFDDDPLDLLSEDEGIINPFLAYSPPRLLTPSGTASLDKKCNTKNTGNTFRIASSASPRPREAIPGIGIRTKSDSLVPVSRIEAAAKQFGPRYTSDYEKTFGHSSSQSEAAAKQSCTRGAGELRVFREREIYGDDIEIISIVETFEILKKSNKHETVFLYDIENVVPGVIEGPGFHILVSTETKKIPSLKIRGSTKLYQCKSTSRCKDAADVLISMICGGLIALPYKPKIVISSKDHFAGAIRDDLSKSGFEVKLVC